VNVKNDRDKLALVTMLFSLCEVASEQKHFPFLQKVFLSVVYMYVLFMLVVLYINNCVKFSDLKQVQIVLFYVSFNQN